MADYGDILAIQLRIDGKVYPVNVRRSEEEFYREAERRINSRLNLYKERFPDQTKEQYLYMALLDLGVTLVREEKRNDAEPYKEVMTNLTAEIMATLGDKA